MDDFERAHRFTATWEGGRVDHPADPGGRTAYGVTQRVYDAWRRSQGQPVRDVWQIGPAEVTALYRTRYWDAYPAPSRLPWPLSAAIYDMCVNHGGGASSRPAGSENGAAGMLARAQARCPGGDPLTVALAACDERQRFYAGIVAARPSQSVFWDGWMNRVNAQRDWLRANADPLIPAVFLRDRAGKTVPWDGKPALYGNLPLSADRVSQWTLVYPPGSKTDLGGVRLSVFADGALLLERL